MGGDTASIGTFASCRALARSKYVVRWSKAELKEGREITRSRPCTYESMNPAVRCRLEMACRLFAAFGTARTGQLSVASGPLTEFSKALLEECLVDDTLPLPPRADDNTFLHHGVRHCCCRDGDISLCRPQRSSRRCGYIPLHPVVIFLSSLLSCSSYFFPVSFFTK